MTYTFRFATGCRKIQATGAQLRGRGRRHHLLQIQRRCWVEGREEEVMARFAHVVARSFVHQHDRHVLLYARHAHETIEIAFRHPLKLTFSFYL